MTNARFPTTKLLVVVLLLFIALTLGSRCLTLQLRISEEQNRLKYKKASSVNVKKTSAKTKEKEQVQTSKTIQSTLSTNDIFSVSEHQRPPPHGLSHKTIGEAYWRMASSALQIWDVLINEQDASQKHFYHNRDLLVDSTKPDANPRFSLTQAAKSGHPLAQYYLANTMASGIWPFIDEDDEDSESTFDEDLEILDEWLPSTEKEHPQIASSFLYYHMAAMAGNVEASMALAHRMDLLSADDVCTNSLPYYEAAAHGIIDQLEASPHSRAKVVPLMDKHILAQVHMHGGTSSQLDWNNKPDESKEAIQFYHLKATTQPWSYSSSNEKKQTTIDVHAASTLGHLYHFGVRGVPQNLTLSLQYYEIAAENNQWESAGHAGTFHLWGMGTEPNPSKALRYFKMGAPGSFATCFRKRELVHLQKKGKTNDEQSISECDSRSLNGMGLIYLLGIEGEIEINHAMAEKFFALAKESGDTDAHYNLAMMYLGWKTQFTNSVPTGQGNPFEVGKSKKLKVPLGKAEESIYSLHHSASTAGKQFKGPSEHHISTAIKLLGVASNRGHLQAKHRLGMMYSAGIEIETSALDRYTVVKRDCVNAKKYYQWIIDNASLARSKRLRMAYASYMHGDLEKSLLNYLAAAEAGSNVGQVNAAFLLEQGVCLSLSVSQCAKASVRLWKAAAERGNAEACLRVGDFYYYGRLRGTTRLIGPYSWGQYLLFPEVHIVPKLQQWKQQLSQAIQHYQRFGEFQWPEAIDSSQPQRECLIADDGKETCPLVDHDEQKEWMDADLSMAAHYYTIAIDKYVSARANFNLGYMHEWGIGLKQDFPLAKRHYDLAATLNGSEAQLAVSIALLAMSQHENFVKLQNAWNEWWNKDSKSDDKKSVKDVKKETVPVPKDIKPEVDQPVPPPGPSKKARVPKKFPKQKTSQQQKQKKRRWDVIQSHLRDHSTLVICGLIFCLLQLIEMRARHQQMQHPPR